MREDAPREGSLPILKMPQLVTIEFAHTDGEMLRRRDLLACGFSVAGFVALGGTSACRANARTAVSPLDYGATGNGVANDLVAVRNAANHAFANNLVLEGGTHTYGIHGDLTFSNKVNPKVRNLRLTQIDPDPGQSTFGFVDCEKVEFDGVHIDVGSAADVGDMQSTLGLFVKGGSHHDIRNVTATGDGKVTYVKFWLCSDSVFSNIIIRDGTFDDAAADDDVVQGIRLDECTNCVLHEPQVQRLLGNASVPDVNGVSRVYSRAFTRGIALGGCRKITIENPRISDVDQGIDISGSDGNWEVIVNGGHTYQCLAHGVKMANTAINCKAIGHIAQRTGGFGFVASGGNVAENQVTATRDCEFRNCKALDVGWFDVSCDHERLGDIKSGFAIVYYEEAGFTPPQGTRITNCRAIDQKVLRLAGARAPAGPAAGETTATLAETFTGRSKQYLIRFDTGETRNAEFTEGSTSVAWSGGLRSAAREPHIYLPATMNYGFFTDVTTAPAENQNKLSNCYSRGHTTAGTYGF